MCIGGSIGYFTGDPLRLLDDAQTLKPHFFPSVPRVLNKLYQGAMLAGNAPSLRGAIFRKAVAAKLEKLHATGDNTHVFWDKLIFRKVRISNMRENVILRIWGSRFELYLEVT
jgi:long-chain acyl-CoA synthetase